MKKGIGFVFVTVVFLFSECFCSQAQQRECQPDGSIRLVGGSGAYEGNVQLCLNGTWGYVCDNNWDKNEATVVCRQLGYTDTNSSFTNHNNYVRKLNSHFGSGNGIVYLDFVYCSEDIHHNLTSCPHGNITCNPYADIAGVVCIEGKNCTNGDIRLIGKSVHNSRSEGRVEICNNNQWGGICCNSWSDKNSQVVCRQLGYNSYFKMSPCWFSNEGPIAFSSTIQCNGTESSLSTCNKSVSIAPASCPQCETVGVRCYSTIYVDNSTQSCTEGSIKLWSAYNNTPSNEGMILICRNKKWRVTCDAIVPGAFYTPFKSPNEFFGGHCHFGRIVCRSLGYDGAIALRSNAEVYYGHYNDDNYYRLLYDCYSDDDTIDQCGVRSSTCDSYINALGVICADDTTVMKECTDGDIRLVNGGSTVNRGRVEYCYKGQWSPMCSLDTTTAQLLCKRLGYDNNKRALIDYRESFGVSYAKCAFHHFECSYWHTDLSQCSISTKSMSECYARNTCYKEYGLTCDYNSDECNISSKCSKNGNVRLVDGSGKYEGNVQLCMNGVWGYICDHGWYHVTAQVVCEQLGYTSSNVTATRRSYFGLGNEIIHFGSIYCSSPNIGLLINCTHGVTKSNCNQQHLAGVKCISAVGGNCSDGDTRLTSFIDLSHSEGHLEVCINNQWGTVCANSSWTSDNTKVVCRQLGYSDKYFESLGLNYYGEKGFIPVALRDVQCNGNELSLLSCSQNVGAGCTSDQDIVIRCYSSDDSMAMCSNGDYRLWSAYDSTSENEGLLHVCMNNTWYPVADSSDCLIIKIACRSLGYDGAIASIKNAEIVYGRYHPKTPQILTYSCFLGQCYQHTHVASTHSIFPFLGVACAYDTWTDLYRECTDGDVRLVNGPSVRSGRVEYCYEGQWTPMCSLSATTAKFVCKKLGFNNNYVLIDNQETYGISSIRSRFDYLFCGSSSEDLSHCSIHTKEILIDGDFCGHDECFLYSYELTKACDTEHGLTCTEFSEHTERCTNDDDIRLAGGLIEQEGRAEVCVEGIWGTVCETRFGYSESKVFCRTLGYNGSNQDISYRAHFGQGNGFPVWDRLDCNSGSESTISECFKRVYPVYPIGCTAADTIGIRCKDKCADGDIRLANGPSIYEGTVEVCFNELWGLIDDNGWSLNNAKVVCFQLGYLGEVMVRNHSYYGKPNLAIHLADVQCTGNEESILNCSRTTYCIEEGIEKMHSVEVAGVNCSCVNSSICEDSSVQSTSSTTITRLTTSASITVMASLHTGDHGNNELKSSQSAIAHSSVQSSSHSTTTTYPIHTSTINNVTTSDNSQVIGISIGISVFVVILMIVVLASVSVLLVVFKIKKKRSSYVVSMVRNVASSDHDSDESSIEIIEESELTDDMTLLDNQMS